MAELFTKKQTVLIVVVVISLLVFFVSVTVRIRDNCFYGNKRFEQEIIPENIEVINGIVDSPSVKIPLDSSDEFVTKIIALDIDVVYKASSDAVIAYYYVFTDNYQIAYFFQPAFDVITGEMTN